jgi:flagellar basal body rod protein FlgG
VTDLSQGAIRESGNPLDVAIAGPGFFVVTTPNGERYTRQGQFDLDETGRLVTSAGHPVQSKQGNDITLPPGRIEIAADGRISVNQGNISDKPTERATLRLVRFLDSEAVLPEGGALFRAREGAGVVDADPTETQLIQGSVEDANVDVIKGLLQIIEVARGYEAYMHAMRKVDGLVEIAIRQVGGRG